MANLKTLFVIGGILVIFSLILVAVVTSSNSTSITNFPTVEPLPIEDNGGLAVNVQDQSTRPFDIRLNSISSYHTLQSSPVLGGYDLVLEVGHSIDTGDYLAFLEENGKPEILFGKVTNVNVNTITLDTPVPYSFNPSKTTVFNYSNNMAVDGSTTPQIFSITNFFKDDVDIVRFIFHLTDGSSMDDGSFGGMTELNNGIVLRKRSVNGDYTNYWNLHNNGEFGELAYDKTYDDKAPAGVYGLTVRATYGGQSKHGVVIRLETGESIEMIIQDDLTELINFNGMVQGHFTTD